MLRLSTKPHPHYQHNLDELFLHVYVLVDDWLKANEMRFNLPQQRTQIVSCSKLFTVAIVGELVAQPYESVWYWLVCQSYQSLFPRLLEYSRYYRMIRALGQPWPEHVRSLLEAELKIATTIRRDQTKVYLARARVGNCTALRWGSTHPNHLYRHQHTSCYPWVSDKGDVRLSITIRVHSANHASC